MPLDPQDLFVPQMNLFEPRREVEDVPFDELIHQLAGSIAQSQAKLDKSTAEVMKTLATEEVEMPTKIERTITEDGQVRSGNTETEKRSLLELGLAPTRYQFSEANLEVEFDLHITEKESSDSEDELEMRAGTYEATEQRKYTRDVKTNATMNAKLEPVPLPAGMSPSENVQQPEEDGENAGGSNDGDSTTDDSNDADSETESESTDGEGSSGDSS